MDGVSAAASVLGIASAAIHSVNLLIHDIKAIKDAPEVIADLKDELAAVEAVLRALNKPHNESQLENLTADVKTMLRLAISSCQKACDKFRTKLARWTRNSGEEIHWRDRVRVALFAEGAIEALSQQLSRCTSTMNAAVSTATLINSVALSSTCKAMERSLHAKEIEISEEMMEIDEQAAVTEKALQKTTESQDLNEQGHSILVEQLQSQQESLSDCRKLLEELLAQAHQLRTGQRITKVEMRDGGKLLVGFINYDHTDGEIHQEIHDVKATNHGKGVVGMVKGFDVNAFFND